MWLLDQIYNLKNVFIDLYPSLLMGLKVTLGVTFWAIIGTFVLGLISCMMELSGMWLLKGISRIYVYCIRGTPFMVQLFLVFFGIPQVAQLMGYELRIDEFWASVVTCAINGGAYMSEVFRSGIQSVARGQKEAAKSLGIPKFYIMKKIVLPQAIRSCIGAIGNQFIITFKDTSICSAIALADIVYMGKLYIGKTMQPFATYLVIGIFYIVTISIMSLTVKCIERRLNYGTKNTNKICV